MYEKLYFISSLGWWWIEKRWWHCMTPCIDTTPPHFWPGPGTRNPTTFGGNLGTVHRLSLYTYISAWYSTGKFSSPAHVDPTGMGCGASRDDLVGTPNPSWHPVSPGQSPTYFLFLPDLSGFPASSVVSQSVRVTSYPPQFGRRLSGSFIDPVGWASTCRTCPPMLTIVCILALPPYESAYEPQNGLNKSVDRSDTTPRMWWGTWMSWPSFIPVKDEPEAPIPRTAKRPT